MGEVEIAGTEVSEPEPWHGEGSDHFELELSPQNEESNEQVDTSTDRMCGTATDLTLGTGAHNDVEVIMHSCLGITWHSPAICRM